MFERINKLINNLMERRIEMERLQKVIANSGFCSRRKAEELISQGKVKVNNQIVTEQGTKVSNDDRIEINGTLLPLKEEKEYYLLYKPEKTISSVKDEKGRKTVTELIPSKGRIYPVGRLDYDTTGVLLLTNDGELTNILTHPKNKIEKFYRAKVTGVVTREEVMKIKKGIEIEGRKTIPTYVKVKKVNQETQTTIIYLGINEGRNHIVKKIMSALGHKVIELKRERVAFLTLDGLKKGDYRPLTIKEVKKLYSLK